MPLVETGMVPSGSMCRTTSCVDDPQGTVLEALKYPDMRLMSDLLSEEGAVDPNKQYATDSFKTLLHIALDLENTEAVKILLSGGAKADHFNTTLKLTAVHVAAMKGNHEALSILIRSGGPKSLDVKDRSGRTALHLSTLGCGKENEEKYLKCVKVLIERGAGLNVTDNKGGQTPLYIAAAGSSFAAVKILMDSGADASIPCQGVSTKQLIKDRFNKEQVESLDLDNPSIISGDMLRQTLFNMVDKAELDGPDDLKWRSMLAKAKPYLDADNGKMTLTQICAERGLHTYLEQLLQNGADPNIYTIYRSSPPVLLAAAAGQSEVIRVMAEHNQANMNNNAALKIDFTVLDDEFRQTVLHQIIRKPRLNLGLSENSASVDYESCLNAILDSKETNFAAIINKQDILGNTPLHYATQFWDQETVTKLLLLGANIGLRNNLGEAPISNILPDTMESFLDNHCLKSEGNPTNEDFKITFHYDFLAPPRENDGKHIQLQDAEQGAGQEEKTPQPETDVLWYMARSKDHRHLLKHPVITSFLSLKWSRISSHYNSNMLFFTILVGTLTAYIFSNYAGFSLGVVQPICQSNNTDDSTQTAQPFGNSHTLWWMLTVLLGLLVFRELLQFSISPGQHFNSVENILEVLLIILTGVLLFDGHPGCNVGFKRELSTAVLLFSWIELVTMVGRHPRLSSYNIYSTMFYRVLKTFISFLTWYSLFIIAFGLCFYILLHEDDGKEKEYPFFDHLGLALVKTFSMFVGELEFSDIPFNSPFSYFFFLAFVFLIVVVLMNLLNGLAVSDTGLIREEAEIHAHVSRVEVISQAEATLLGDPAHLLKGHGWLNKLIPTCGLRRRLGSALRCQTFFRTITASNGILLFYSFLPNKRLVVYPNKDNLVCSTCFSAKEVGRDILKSAKDLILKLNEEEKKNSTIENAVRSIQIKQQKLEKKLDEVLKGLESITRVILN